MEHAGLPLKGHHAGLRMPGACSLCLAWTSPQPQPSTCPSPRVGGGVVIVCWRRGQGTLPSSKGPPLPKPTYPAATQPSRTLHHGAHRADPLGLSWRRSSALSSRHRVPSPHFLQKAPWTPPFRLAPSYPIMSTLPPTGSPRSVLPSQMQTPLLNAHRPEALGDPRCSHRHPMPLPSPF